MLLLPHQLHVLHLLVHVLLLLLLRTGLLLASRHEARVTRHGHGLLLLLLLLFALRTSSWSHSSRRSHPDHGLTIGQTRLVVRGLHLQVLLLLHLRRSVGDDVRGRTGVTDSSSSNRSTSR